MDLLTVREVAEFCGVSCDTVRRWADGAILPSFRLPSGHRRFELREVLAFREGLRQQVSSTLMAVAQ